ncbi:hypothetical protein L208DRAFT_1013204, partial [Tricholoma matsutake]
HLDCDPSQPLGCSRCRPLAPSLCCDIHNPNSFRQFFVPASKRSHIPAQSRIPKDLPMTDEDFALWEALDNWQEAKTILIYGRASLRDVGSVLAMPTKVLDRIVECAHIFKIRSLDNLQRETRWERVDKWGSEILLLI